jgi:hypothetical protein
MTFLAMESRGRIRDPLKKGSTEAHKRNQTAPGAMDIEKQNGLRQEERFDTSRSINPAVSARNVSTPIDDSNPPRGRGIS